MGVVGEQRFNYDFHVTSMPRRPVETIRDSALGQAEGAWSVRLGRRQAGLSAFALDGDVVTTRTPLRGFDAIWTMWQCSTRALGSNQGDLSWLHRHDEYEASSR